MCVVTVSILSHLGQISTLTHFSRIGKMITKGWKEFTRTFSGMFNLKYLVGCCTYALYEAPKAVCDIFGILFNLL